MLALVGAQGMPLASASRQAGQVRVAGAAIFALVFGFLAAFIQSVFTFIRTIRMTLTSSRRKVVNAGRFSAAKFAIVAHGLLGGSILDQL